MVSRTKLALLTTAVLVPLVLIALSMSLAVAQGDELDVGVFKSDDLDPVPAGEDLSYTILVTNSDGVTATNVLVTDTLPLGVEYITDTDNCLENSGVLTCTLENLAPGEEVSFTIDVHVALGAYDPDDPQICNSVEVSATTELGGGDTNLANNTEQECTTLLEEADLTMEKSAFPGDVVPFGEWFSYTLHVENLGPSNSRVPVVMDWFATDGSLTAVVPYGDGLYGECGPMPTDQGWAEAPAWLLNWVDAVCDLTGDPYFCDAIEPWWEAWWAYWYNSFPPNYPYPLAVDWMCIWYTDGLEPGEPIDLTVDVLPLDAQTIYNQAWVVPDMYPYNWFEEWYDGDGWGTPDPDYSNNVDEVVTRVTDVADLSIDKSLRPCDPPCGVAGGMEVFSIEVVNGGPSTAENVVVEDLLPAGVTVESVTPSTGSCTTGTPGDPLAPLTCNLGEMPVGITNTIRVEVRIDPDYMGDLENDAWVYSDMFDPNNGDNRDHVIDQVSAYSELYGWKGCPQSAMAGEELDYWIAVSNNGPSTVRELTFADNLTDVVTYVGHEIVVGDGTCSYIATDHTLFCSLGDVDPQETHAINLTVRVNPDYEGLLVSNYIDATDDWWADTAFGFEKGTEYYCETAIESLADLSITKTSEPPKVVPGEQKVYHIEVTNNGPSDAPNVVVSDTLPVELRYQIDTDNCDVVGGPPDLLRCDLGTIPAGQSVQFDIHALVQPDYPVTETVEITNVAEVWMETEVVTDTNLGNNSDWTTNLILPPNSADLAIQKWWEEAPPEWFPGEWAYGPEECYPDGAVRAGCPLIYALVITNTGPLLAENVVVEDFLPAGVVVDNVGAPGSCTTGIPGDPSAPLTCNLGNVPPGEDRRIDIIVVADADLAWERLENDAVVSSDIPDPDDANNRAHVLTWVEPFSYLNVDKHGPEEITAGEEIQYWIDLWNEGPSTAHDVYVDDELPGGVSLLDAQVMIGDGSCAPNSTLCSLGDLAPNEWNSVRVRGYVEPWLEEGTVVTNTVRAWANSPFFQLDPAQPISDTWETLVHSAADLSIRKTADPYKVYAGEQVRYDVSVSNNGPSVARNVVVTDTLPISVTYEIDTAGCSLPPSGILNCNLGDIPPGETSTFSIWARVKPDTLGMINNRVDVMSETEDPNPDNNWDTEANLVLGKADLRVVKFGKPDGTVEAGEELVYTVIVDNLGPGYAHEVVLYDLFRSSDWAYYFDDYRTDLPAYCSDDRTSRETTITCHLADPLEVMSPDSSGRWVLKFYFEVFEEQSVNNVADVVGADFDPDLSNNHAMTEHEITAVADLDLEKEAWGDVLVGCDGYTEQWKNEVAAGGMLTYTLEIYNEGPSEAENVVVEDWGLSPFLDIVDVQCEKDDSWRECSCNLSGLGELGDTNRHLVCYMGEIDRHDEDVIIITARIPSDVPEGTRLVNDARVYSDVFDDDNGDNLDSNWTYVLATADLGVEKSQEPDVTLPGLDVTYTITVTNHGLSDAHGVLISDTLPFTPTTDITMECCASDDGQCDVPCEPPTCPAGECPWPDVDFIAQADIPAGQWVIYTLTAIPEWVPCDTITNTVEVVAPLSLMYEGDIDPCPDNDVATTTSDPECNFVPLALKDYPGPDSPP